GVGSQTVTLSNTLTSATNVTYTVKFKPSASGAMTQDAGSTIKIVLPAGTNTTNMTNSPLNDGATQIGFCQAQPAQSLTIVCFMFGGETINPGDSVSAVLNGLKNPATTNPYSLKLSDTSDTVVRTLPYCVAAAGVPCIASFTPKSGPVGHAVTINGINL